MSAESFPDQPINPIEAFIAEVPESRFEYSDDPSKPPVHVRERKINEDETQILYRFGESTYIADFGNGLAHVVVGGKEFTVSNPTFALDPQDEIVTMQCKNAQGKRLALTVFLEDGSVKGTFLPSREPQQQKESDPSPTPTAPQTQPEPIRETQQNRSKETSAVPPKQEGPRGSSTFNWEQAPHTIKEPIIHPSKQARKQEAPTPDPEPKPTVPTPEEPNDTLEKKTAAQAPAPYTNQVGKAALDLEQVVIPGAKRRAISRAGIYKNAPAAVDVPGAKGVISHELKVKVQDGKARSAVKKGKMPGHDKGWVELGGAFEIKASPATKEAQKYVVAEHPSSPTRKARIAVGRLGGHTLAAPENISVTVLGPPGSGKTREMKRQAMEWLMSDSGFVAFYSTKPELDLINVAEKFGPVHVFAPFGLGEQNKEIEQKLESYICKISPVDACQTWEGSKTTASTLVAVSQEGMSKTSNDSFFVTQAGILFSVALWSAQKVDRPMSDVISVVKQCGTPDSDGRAELAAWLHEIGSHPDIDPIEYKLAVTDFKSFIDKTAKTGGSIAGQLEVILDPWSVPSVMKATERSTLIPEDLVNKPGTLIIVGTDSDTKHGQIYANLIGRISEATRKHQKLDPVTYRHIPADHGTAIFVDEAQNIGMDKTLMSDVVQGRGYGLVRVSGIQNGKGFAKKYGDGQLETLVNSSVIVAHKGLDAHTADLIQAQAGTYEVKDEEPKPQGVKGLFKTETVSMSKDGLKLPGQAASKNKAIREPSFTINDTKQLKDNQSVVMFQAGSLAKVESVPYYEDHYITSIQERNKKALTLQQLAEQTGADLNDTSVLNYVRERYEAGHTLGSTQRRIALLTLADKGDAMIRERRERKLQREEEKRAAIPMETIEVPYIEGDKPASMVIPSDRDEPVVKYDETLVASNEAASRWGFKKRKAQRTQPVRAVGRYLGIGPAPLQQRNEQLVNEIDIEEKEN